MADVKNKSIISEINVEPRAEQMKRNNFNDVNIYNKNHPDALSDGDEMGRGEVNGVVGTSGDISQRTTLMAKNKYQKGKPYNAFL